MLRKATQDDLPALVALRCKAARTNRTDAAGWLQNVAGLENILLLVKSGAPPAAMLAAVPVEYGQHHGVWLCGLAGEQGVPLDRLLPKLLESCLRAYGASGFDFAVMTPEGAQHADALKQLGFTAQLPLRVLQTPIRRDLLAQASFGIRIHISIIIFCLKQRIINVCFIYSNPANNIQIDFLQFFKRFRMFFCWNIGFVVLRISRLIYLIGIP